MVTASVINFNISEKSGGVKGGGLYVRQIH